MGRSSGDANDEWAMKFRRVLKRRRNERTGSEDAGGFPTIIGDRGYKPDYGKLANVHAEIRRDGRRGNGRKPMLVLKVVNGEKRSNENYRTEGRTLRVRRWFGNGGSLDVRLFERKRTI